MIELPVIDLQHYKRTGDQSECAKAAESLHKYGVLCLRDEVRACVAMKWLPVISTWHSHRLPLLRDTLAARAGRGQ